MAPHDRRPWREIGGDPTYLATCSGCQRPRKEEGYIRTRQEILDPSAVTWAPCQDDEGEGSGWHAAGTGVPRQYYGDV